MNKEVMVMSTEDCEKLVAKASSSYMNGLLPARTYKLAAECFRDSGALKEAIRYFDEAANTVMKISYPKEEHYVFAIQSLTEAAELSFEIDRYQESTQFLEEIDEMLNMRSCLVDRKRIEAIKCINEALTNLDENLYSKGLLLVNQKTVKGALRKEFTSHAFELAPPSVEISRKLPEIIKENEVFLVNIDFSSRYKHAYDVKMLEQIPKDFEIVDGMTQWTGDLPVEKKICLSYRLRPKSFGNFVLKPTKITFKGGGPIWKNKTFTSKGESFEIRVVPMSIKIVKQLSIEETNVSKEVEIKILAVNKSEKDIYNVVFSDEVPEKQDFDYVGSSSTVRKQLRKGETRTFKSKLIPKTIGEFKLGSATLKFLDHDEVEFELKSNDVKLKVTEKPIEWNKIELLEKEALEDKLLKLSKTIEKVETRIIVLEKKIRLCPNCGALAIDPKSKFCGICGQKIH